MDHEVMCNVKGVTHSSPQRIINKLCSSPQIYDASLSSLFWVAQFYFKPQQPDFLSKKTSDNQLYATCTANRRQS